MPSDVRLLVNGENYGGWTEIDIRHSVETLASTFDLKVVELWPDQIAAREIPVGARCEVQIDGQTVITGWVDDVEPGYDASSHSVSVRGRDATGDLVDCTAVHAGGQWINQTLLQIARDLCKPFGISVRATTDVGAAFPAWQIQQGETIQDNLQRAASQRGVLLITDGRGALLIARASAQSVATALERGINIVSASGTRSHRERFSEYRVVGQQPMSDDNGFDEQATQVSAKASDKAVTRYRPLAIVAEDNVSKASAKERADWERNVRAGRSVSAAFTLAAWRHADGLWMPDRRVTVRDPWLRIDGELYISAVNFRLSEQGERAIVSATLPQAFARIALPDPDAEPLR